MPSFDIVSEVNLQEVDNAVNQSIKEIQSRYDFKGSKSEIIWDKKEITLVADDDYKLQAIKDILQGKVHKRGIDMKALDFGNPESATGQMIRVKVKLRQGIEKEMAKEIIKKIKDSKLKVQPSVVDDKVRVSSKSIDELQATMALIRSGQFSVPLQFDNMRS